MDEAKLAEIEARSLPAVPKCNVCNAPARWTTGAYRMVEDFCEACTPKSRFPLQRLQFAELDSLDLVAEVRRLTAALATARREGAEEMRERCDDALDRLERYYRATERDVKAHAVERGAAWERGAAIENARDTIRALPLDAPGGAT